MDGLSSNSFLMMQRSMEFLWSKQSCILDNIANVETPGYQVKYATFEEALKMPSSPPPKMESPLLPSGRPLKRHP